MTPIIVLRFRRRAARLLRGLSDKVAGPTDHFTLLTTAKECESWMQQRYGRGCANPKEHYR